jgi:hypothetical protein
MFGLPKRARLPRQAPAPGELPRLDAAVDEFRPVSPRQRRWIIAITVATVFMLWLLLLYRPGGTPRVIPPGPSASAPAPCAPGQTRGCVGGKAEVMLLPAASSPAAGPRP